MTGNRLENEAGVDGQENRTKDYCETTDRPVTEEEVGEASRHLKKNKAIGWDGIPGDVLKHVDAILLYFSGILDSGYFPEF